MRKIILAVLVALVPTLALAQNLTSVGVTNGVPTSGTGTVSTIDALLAVLGAQLSSGADGVSNSTVGAASYNFPLVFNGTTWDRWYGDKTNGAWVNVKTSVLPTGAATSANQSTANGYLSTVASNIILPIPDCGATPCTNKIGNVYLQGQFPAGATPITGNATGTTGAVVGTLANTSSVTTYICGFDVSAIGGTAAIGPITVAGLVGSSMVYELASTTTGVTLAREYNPCIPASAVNTPITITTTADGTATAVAVNSHGFQQ